MTKEEMTNLLSSGAPFAIKQVLRALIDRLPDHPAPEHPYSQPNHGDGICPKCNGIMQPMPTGCPDGIVGCCVMHTSMQCPYCHPDPLSNWNSTKNQF